MSRIVIFLLGLLTVSAAVAQTAEPESAVLVFLDGTAEMLSGDSWITLEEGDRVPVNARIRTGKLSLCELQFGQMGALRLTAATQVDLKTIRLQGTTRAVDLKVITGQIMAKVNKLTGNERFIVQTTTVNCGVRGTEFLVGADEDAATVVAVSEGEVVILAPTYDPASWDELLSGADTSEVARSALDELFKDSPSVRSGNEIRVEPHSLQAQAEVMQRVQQGLGKAALQGRDALTKHLGDLKQAPGPGLALVPRPMNEASKASFQGPNPLQVRGNLPPPPPPREGGAPGRDAKGQLLPVQPGQLGQGGKPGQPGQVQPGQPGQPGLAQPGQAGKPGQPGQAQPGQAGKPGQPGQAQPGQAQPSQPGPGAQQKPQPTPQPAPGPKR